MVADVATAADAGDSGDMALPSADTNLSIPTDTSTKPSTTSPSQDEDETDTDSISLTLTHHGTTHTFQLPATSTLTDLNAAITDRLGISNILQKLMITPKIGLLKPPYRDPTLPLSTLVNKKIQLLAPLQSELDNLAAASSTSALARQQRGYTGPLKVAKPSRTVPSQAQSQADATYTFGRIEALRIYRDPEKSQRFLERLAADPGIRAAMRRHKFRVGLLTEMDPAAHTHSDGSKTLGLNRNAGEAIYLRLRTDAYDGYRDYRTIRKTLCHELAHNVHGEHDRKFWDLMAQIEKEVGEADYLKSGRTTGAEADGAGEFYNPRDRGVRDDEVDGGGGRWTGGAFVLGGGGGGGDDAAAGGVDASTSAQTGGAQAQPALQTRDLLARAAEERMKRQRESERGKKNQG